MIRVFRVHSRLMLLSSLISANLRLSNLAAAQIPLNKVNPPLNFIRFFNPLRFFVASTFPARL